MPDANENEFLNRITAIVEANIGNEQFGVSELAAEMNMSRSNLLRKVKKLTKLSVSQLISQVRLKRSMELLRKSSYNVSEVSHQVGFSSTSYFIKCFREYYGYPPGEVGKRDASPEIDLEASPVAAPSTKGRNLFMIGAISFIILLSAGVFVYYSLSAKASSTASEKSIVVLPFKNDSNDSTNVYLINGLMESTLNNLQQIKDLKVISRTSAEKYRNSTRSIPEMANELHVNYFVEGSGQKIGDEILLNIQLIEGATDRHLWAKQYKRQAKDIFKLQQEIAKNIAEEIQAIITPEEKMRIEKIPTENLEAYDQFLKGRDLLVKGGGDNLEKSILYFKKAIALDDKFALAYADATIAFYYLDMYMTEKKYANEMNTYADKALLFDSKRAESLVAKALFYMHKKEYNQAVPYFEKALEYNPNSILVVHFLADLYANYIPNTGKYLEYALKGVQLGIASQDSIAASYTYLHLSNAFMQTGFLDEALKNINKSLAYNPSNPFGYLKIFIRFAKSRDCSDAKTLLLKELSKDTTRIDILEEIGKICFMARTYDSAYHYYKKFITAREAQHLEIYKHENLRMAIVLEKMGMKQKAAAYVKSFKDYADQDRSIYKHMHLVGYYAHEGDQQQAIAHLKLFAKENNFQYWILLANDDPMFDSLKSNPEFKRLMHTIETTFWDNNKKIKAALEEKELL